MPSPSLCPGRSPTLPVAKTVLVHSEQRTANETKASANVHRRSTPESCFTQCLLSPFRFLEGDKWFWMSGGTENFTYFETKHYWGDTSPCGAMDTSGRFYWRDRPCDENSHFICLKGIIVVLFLLLVHASEVSTFSDTSLISSWFRLSSSFLSLQTVKETGKEWTSTAARECKHNMKTSFSLQILLLLSLMLLLIIKTTHNSSI